VQCKPRYERTIFPHRSSSSLTSLPLDDILLYIHIACGKSNTSTFQHPSAATTAIRVVGVIEVPSRANRTRPLHATMRGARGRSSRITVIRARRNGITEHPRSADHRNNQIGNYCGTPSLRGFATARTSSFIASARLRNAKVEDERRFRDGSADSLLPLKRRRLRTVIPLSVYLNQSCTARMRTRAREDIPCAYLYERACGLAGPLTFLACRRHTWRSSLAESRGYDTRLSARPFLFAVELLNQNARGGNALVSPCARFIRSLINYDSL